MNSAVTAKMQKKNICVCVNYMC